MHTRRGFTLIELSIVLVIVGLIAGGVLVGRDLIKAAHVRSTVKTVETITTGINMFKLKYNCTPGDCVASALGINGTAGTNYDGNGDGMVNIYGAEFNNMIASPDAQTSQSRFIKQLENSGLIQTRGPTTLPDLPFGRAVVPLKVGQDSSLMPVAYNRGSAFYAAGMIGFDEEGAAGVAGCSGFFFHCPTLTPLEALQLDTKMDDGTPDSGAVLAAGPTADALHAMGEYFTGDPSAGPSGDGTSCLTSASSRSYNTENTSNLCLVMVNFKL